MFRHEDERGAAAVEFALVLPILLLFVFGIVELSQAQFDQALVADAARQAARSYAITGDVDAAVAAGIRGGQSVELDATNFAIEPAMQDGGCLAGADAVVTVTYNYQAITGLVPTPITIVGRAVFACER